MAIPDYITHYYLPDKEPFLNLSDLREEEMKPILDDLEERRKEGQLKRGFPDWYFPQRQEAEANLLEAFRAKGGLPERKSPHYFTLGRSKMIEWIYNDNYKMVQIPIERVEKHVHFSMGDTLYTFARQYNEAIAWENRWYQGKLYSYAETVMIIGELGLDLDNSEMLKAYQVMCVEGLMWSDRVLREALEGIYFSGK